MEGFSKAKVAIGRPSPVKFNFGVVGETGAGRRTFIKAFTEPYDFNHSDCQVNVVPDAELTSTSLRNKHNQWLDGYKRPATDEQRNSSDSRVHCIFYLFSPHRVLPEDKVRIQQLHGLAPIVPVLAKADAMTLEERSVQLRAVQAMMNDISKDATLPVFFEFDEPEAMRASGAPTGLGDPVPSSAHIDHSQSLGVDVPDEMVAQSQAEISISSDHSDGSYQFPTTEFTSTARDRANTDLTEESSQVNQGDGQAVPLGADGPTRSAAHSPSQQPHAALGPDVSLQDPFSAISGYSWASAVPKVRNIFAVICAVNPQGLRVYPWGTVDTHDETVSDLRRLQRLVFENGSIGRLRALTQQMSIRQHAQNQAAKRPHRCFLSHCPECNFWTAALGLSLTLLLGVVVRMVFGFK